MAQDGQRIDRRRARALFLAVVTAVIAIDQVTKHLAVTSLEGQDSVRLLGGAVYLTLLRNSGAAFSLGTGYTFVFPIIALAVGVGLLLIMRGVRSVPWAVGLGLVFGGAWGNATDRVFRSPGPFMGHVVDMVSVFGDNGRVFPVFNAADSALTVGVVIILLLELTGRRRDGTRAAKEPPGATGGGAGVDERAPAADAPGRGST